MNKKVKKCYICHTKLRMDEFRKTKRLKSGLKPFCIYCEVNQTGSDSSGWLRDIMALFKLRQ